MGAQGMSEEITKELREFAKTFFNLTQRGWLTAMADRIDRQHETEVEEARNAGYDEGFGCADDWFAVGDDVLDEHGLMRLPTDRDGKAWRVGDEADVAGIKSYVVALTRDSVLVAHGKDMWNEGVSFPSKSIGHYSPRPAERIRAWVDNACDLVEGPDYAALLGIADELEGAGHE